ncbi:MAG TPA: DoxX family protein [Gemmatimonadaceae bacterium]|jgi:putative oxidoreductase
MPSDRSVPSRHIDAALLVIRIALGIIMIAHGYQKVFTMGLGAVTGGFTQMGVPMPAMTAPIIAFVELLGGCAVLIGLLTRLASLGLAIDMLGAITFVHFKNGFFLPTGFEYPMALLFIAIALTLAGPGEYSIDAMIAGRRTGASNAP